jgi:flagellar biosynthesis protein FlhG
MIVSGKGGVGKTHIAVNVGLALATAGRRVLLVDADLGLANVDLVLGERPARLGWGHVLAGRARLESIIQDGPAGIRWIAGASHVPPAWRMDERWREALLSRLADLEAEHDFLVIDAPAGIGRGVMHLVGQADELLLVTTPEPTAMMDAYALLKAAAMAKAVPPQVRLIVNMVTHRADADGVHRRIEETARRFLGLRVGLLGYVYCDGHVGQAVRRQEPLLVAYPHSQAAWCMKHLAGAILDGAGHATRGDGTEAASRPGGFFRRLANLLAGE